ncbi:MAG: DUF5683 domain-containing protein [Crocinitomicaceae bacterium]|nr:hypothetical protein [Crocinitomicaceae bacterium]
MAVDDVDMVKTPLIIILLSMLSFSALADDTLNVPKDKWADYEHKPKRAALFSLFPGAGQIYNEIGYRRIPKKKHRAWWKVPIIYGGLGACGYYYYQNLSQSLRFKEEILYRRENPGLFLYSDLVIYSNESALINGTGNYLGFDQLAKRRDIFLFASIAIYGLNIIEAYVDGHFVTFDVSQDLSFSWSPVMLDRYTPGVNFQLNFN